MSKIRVLVVDDSLTVRKRLVEAIGKDPGLTVVGEASDGAQAVELCRSLRPDVVTLDMVMPVMSGVDATSRIMAEMPTPILIVSASTNRGELFQTYDALAAGAVDAFDKPNRDDPSWEARFLSTVRLVSRIKVITHMRGRLTRTPRSLAAAPVGLSPYALVAMGASTGGPGAVAKILRGLPADFALPILLVVHIGEPFGASFAEWLDGLAPMPVRMARDGEPLPGPGTAGVLMAPPDRHLEVRAGRLWLSSAPERHCCRPSVDVLFESVARELGDQALGCLLTGMGRDGATGLLAIQRAGGKTLAQDEASSVVYGMPREAARLGAADAILPLDGIADALDRLAAGQRKTP